MSNSRMGIGQHRVGDVGGGNTGQKNIRGTAGDVGIESGGERQNGPVPGAPADSMINMTHGEANTDPHNLRHRK